MTAVFAFVAAFLLVGVGAGSTARAKINSIVTPSSTVDAGARAVITIDADNTKGDVSVITTSGELILAMCDDMSGDNLPKEPCVLQSGTVGDKAAASPGTAPGDKTIVIDDAIVDVNNVDNNGIADSEPATGTDTIEITLECPDPGPSVANVTAIQGGSAKSVTVNCGGLATEIETTVRNKLSETTVDGITVNGKPAGNVIKNINAGTGPGEDEAHTYCRPLDSNGNAATTGAVIFIQSGGTLKDRSDNNANSDAVNQGWAVLTYSGGSAPAG